MFWFKSLGDVLVSSLGALLACCRGFGFTSPFSVPSVRILHTYLEMM